MVKDRLTLDELLDLGTEVKNWKEVGERYELKGSLRDIDISLNWTFCSNPAGTDYEGGIKHTIVVRRSGREIAKYSQFRTYDQRDSSLDRLYKRARDKINQATYKRDLEDIRYIKRIAGR